MARMPTYEYRCAECGSDLEVVQSIHEDSLTECPTCGGKLRKLFGNVGIVFKGSGFYRTDNRSKSKGSGGAKPAPKADKSDSGSASAASGSAKPDASTAGTSTSGAGATKPASPTAAAK